MKRRVSSKNDKQGSRKKKRISENKESTATVVTKMEKLSDLIDYIYNNYNNDERNYRLDWIKLLDILPVLSEINNLIGMEKVKESILNLVLFFITSYRGEKDCFFHSVIYGNPGAGKTHLATLLGKLFLVLGYLEIGHVVSVKRSDLIGKYIGHSEAKFEAICKNAKGGVLLLDEAYSMGGSDRTDSFSKAVVDLLNQHLSENNDFICVVAGYEKEMEECFFSINPGLKRRFPWVFHCEDYSEQDLIKIFYQKIKEDKWFIDCPEPELVPIFKENKNLLKYQGGDIINLFMKSKMMASRRIFLSGENFKTIVKQDVVQAFIGCRKNESIEDNFTHMYL